MRNAEQEHGVELGDARQCQHKTYFRLGFVLVSRFVPAVMASPSQLMLGVKNKKKR